MATNTIQAEPLRFHTKVQTPNGPGLVQGWWVEFDEQGSLADRKVLVSHRPADVPAAFLAESKYRGGPWVLGAYALSEVRA